jgi:hypothetical protein
MCELLFGGQIRPVWLDHDPEKWTPAFPVTVTAPDGHRKAGGSLTAEWRMCAHGSFLWFVFTQLARISDLFFTGF